MSESIRTPRQVSPPRNAGPEKSERPKKSRRSYWIVSFLTLVTFLAVLFWTTSAKLLQEPITLDYGPDAPAFASAMGPLVDGNVVEIQINGIEFFPSMLQAIRAATKSVTFETYIWTPGKISDEFIAALTEPRVAAAHRRMFEKDISRSHRLTFEEFRTRPFYIKAADHFTGLFRSQL